MKKREASLFEDVVEFPPKAQEPSAWERLARSFTLIWLTATRRWVKQAKPAD
ncbi:hypothetical protein [Lysobacter niastensis]|uniref:Uncharacterized protein n=1 Tax=Lysobacter niastensis TaxID=380629 RepID=A0ABS0B5B8_9GAMM|nr:hypothetical protein [Lysobacter niastensis]MBF6024001.1 hypothetical protein [Lysobacter niastensis]